jgi:hypothetical protein
MIDVIAVKGKYDSALLKLQALGFTPPFGLSFVTYNGESAFSKQERFQLIV